jgi:predicted AlkP superfamily phosphohydrolase/phosphomutase
MADRRAFVLGISGATWSVMRPMIDAGALPNLERLCRSGVSGAMASVKAPGDKHFRPQTAWPSLATGRRPEHHGITRFFHTSEDLLVPTIWQLLSSSGRSVGLFGWPMTWPPRPVNGFDVPCHHARDGRTWPPELEVRQAASSRLRIRGALVGLSRLARQGVLWSEMPRLTRAACRIAAERDPRRRRLLLAHLKQEIACELFCKYSRAFRPHASAFVTFLVDWTEHRYWRYREPGEFPDADGAVNGALASAIADAYGKVDAFLGRITAALPDDAVVAVISEHGMAPERVPAEIGRWQYTIDGARLRRIVELPAGVEPRPIARWIAFRPSDGCPLPPDTADRLRDVCVAATGLPLFQVYEHRDEMIVKFDLSRAVDGAGADALDLQGLRLRWRGRDVPFLDVARRGDRPRSAMHAEEGVFVLSGPGIRRGGRIDGARIIDFAPTLARAMGCSFPDWTVDGRPLDVFAAA